MAACRVGSSSNHDMYRSTSSSVPSRCGSANFFGKLSVSCRVTPNENRNDHIWVAIKDEAKNDAMQEKILVKYYHSAILSHSSLEHALANHLAVKLSNDDLSKDALCSVIYNELVENEEIQQALRDDLRAVRERDPACISYVHCLLNFKGFLACQAHRVAHSLFRKGRNVLAFVIQSRVSEVFAMDIHPGAKIGRGIMFDHGTGVVIGETAVIGNNVTILHNVTLGGTGKAKGDRHPKIGDGVMIGAGVKVLGNIRVSENVKIGAGSVVLKDIPAGATAVGNPARLVGSVRTC